MELDTKTYWLTDRQSQCYFDFDLEFNDSFRKGVQWLSRSRVSSDFSLVIRHSGRESWPSMEWSES
jgi:hypothetical protein